MSGRIGERLLLLGLFGALPIVFVLLVLLPSRRRMEVGKARMVEISARLQALPIIQPLSAQERTLLEDPGALWKQRLPSLSGDADRLAHYHRVVSGLQAALRSEGVPLLGVRSTWDGLNGSFTLPADLGNPVLTLPQIQNAGAGKLQGWVLDARIGGSPDRLIQAMTALPRLGPFLEPVGLRWESSPERSRQSLLLRNLILAP